MSSPTRALTRRVRRLVFGRPKRSDQQEHERLSVAAALAVFSSDGLSSVAYATEEILYVLMAAGTAASVYSLPIGLGIVALVLIVAASYAQTIQAYPNGGGSYVVSRENLGANAGLVAGAALLIDYVLTVAVSAAAGIEAVVSAFPAMRGHEVGLALGAIWLIAWVNLRGVRESGTIFSVPTYGFIGAVFLVVGVGLVRLLHGGWHPLLSWTAGFHLPSPGGSAGLGGLGQGVTWFLLLRAFSSGCTALTGLEAVSNGVTAFRPPEQKNAIRTMNLERTILYAMFGGITLLAFGLGMVPQNGQTLLSQIARAVLGAGPLYYAVQAVTALILLVAANTAFADFPRLAGMIAADGYLPRRLTNRGDSLVFHGGIYLLAGLASALVVLFHGSTHLLIPLYAVGVFTAFTLSQTGMVIHWLREGRRLGRGLWRYAWRLCLNGLGAGLCALVLGIVAVTKFTHGAWIVLVLVPVLVGYFRRVHAYYRRFRERVVGLAEAPLTIARARKVKVIVAVGGLTPVVDHALRVARHVSGDITAVHVAVEPEMAKEVHTRWKRRYGNQTPLKVIASPYRDVAGPLRAYLDRLLAEHPGTLVNLMIPVVVTNDPFDAYLHNGTADFLHRELRYTEGLVVTEIPFYVNMSSKKAGVVAYRPRRRRRGGKSSSAKKETGA
jgi:amino acid transporter